VTLAQNFIESHASSSQVRSNRIVQQREGVVPADYQFNTNARSPAFNLGAIDKTHPARRATCMPTLPRIKLVANFRKSEGQAAFRKGGRFRSVN
jgi:hypothetical protein